MSYFGTTDYFLEVSKGNVSGTKSGFIIGINPDVGNTNTETIWDGGGTYVYLTADTQLYASSSSASDTAVNIVVTGLDANYLEVVRTVTLNGQTQVALSGLMFRVHAAVVTGSTSPIGNVYIAETDTLSGGVPDTPDLIKAIIPLSTISGEPADFVSDNISHLGFCTVPAGKTLYFVYFTTSIRKGEDGTISGRGRAQGGVWVNRSPTPLYQSPTVQEFQTRLGIPEKTDLEWRIISGSAGSKIHFQVQFLLVDN
jgi:hypothetical protein